jgi:membrane protease subunit (stomatin/prohibitin family)
MAIIDLIEFFDPTGEIIVTKEPQIGSGEFRLGSQLVVQESQLAVFFKDGKALDGFTAGRHTLTTQNLPLLGALIGAPFDGKSPFRSYVYFVALKTFINLGWGTANPVMFRDADFKMVSLRANGMFSIAFPIREFSSTQSLVQKDSRQHSALKSFFALLSFRV